MESTDTFTVELDEKFIQELETEDLTFQRGEGVDTEKYTLHYATNALELLNDRYNYIRYDPDQDIVKDMYEGGFKVWEGTYDLINFLYNHGQHFNLNGKNILDMGCGCGLVGIFCMKAYDLNSVCFQDFNLEVLKFSTLSNIVKNDLETQIPRCKFISDDWGMTVEKVLSNTNDIVTKLHTDPDKFKVSKFDAIFMSEVLYNNDNYLKIGSIIDALLDQTGICIISSKLYYFGVNGSVDEFKDFMQVHFPHLLIQTLEEINDKKSNKREIFAIGRQEFKI